MRHIAIMDNLFLLDSFRRLAPKPANAGMAVMHSSKGFSIIDKAAGKVTTKESVKRLSDFLELKDTDQILLNYSHAALLKKSLKEILSQQADFQCLLITNGKEDLSAIRDSRISPLSMEELVDGGLQLRWKIISARRKVKKLKSLFKSAKNILILTQHDPDPDAIASALALRTLLNRNRKTAPIGTFGKLTWRENITMARLLDIDIIQVDKKSIKKYEKIAVVDAQPAYFKGLEDKFDAVIDHHPKSGNLKVSYADVLTSYGATSSILTEYLIASGTRVNQRLATALLYGIKTDTLFLGREVSYNDFEAFKYVWPLANHNLLKKMERPELRADEISSFTRALNNRQVIGRALYTFLGRVEKEDIIPRLADFCLQVGDIDWSMVCGIHSGNLVISVRNIGIPQSAGILVRKLFGEVGSAGGHSTMAKAVIPLIAFQKKLGVSSSSDLSESVMKMFKKETMKKGSLKAKKEGRHSALR